MSDIQSPFDPWKGLVESCYNMCDYGGEFIHINAFYSIYPYTFLGILDIIVLNVISSFCNHFEFDHFDSVVFMEGFP